MDEFICNLQKNPSMFYFLVIFAVLWGGGMLWGVLFVIRSLGKRKRAIKALRSAGFEKADGNTEYIRKTADLCLKTIAKQFTKRVDSEPRRELFKIANDQKRIQLSYKIPRKEYRDLPRAVGFQEQIQIIGRTFTLSRILFRASGRSAFYAETNDSETIRAFKPRKRTNSTIGWVLCISSNTSCISTIVVFRKFTGHRKLLLNLALNIANVQAVQPKGILPEFGDAFELNLLDVSGEEPVLEEWMQRIILDYRDALAEGTKIFISPKGIWLSGEVWPDGKQMKAMVNLCDQLSQ